VICLGGWPIGGGMGAIDEKQAIGVVHAALDHGVNFIDTAEGYRNSEEIIGQATILPRTSERRLKTAFEP
jgi:aryl-alcohol dehydrogenase-like predicted oxidoreductase